MWRSKHFAVHSPFVVANVLMQSHQQAEMLNAEKSDTAMDVTAMHDSKALRQLISTGELNGELGSFGTMLVKLADEKQAKPISDAEKVAVKQLRPLLYGLIKMLDDDHDAAKDLLDQASKSVSDCNSEYDKGFSDATNPLGAAHRLREVVKTAKSSLGTCRSEELMTGKNKAAAQQTMDTFLGGLATTAPGACPTFPSTWTEAAADGFFLGSLMNFTADNWQDYADKKLDLEHKRMLASNKKKQCDDFQGKHESAFCAYRTAANVVCATLDSCFTSKKGIYDTLSKSVGDQVKIRKEHAKTVFFMICLADDILDGDRMHKSSCVMNHDVNNYTLTAPSPDNKKTCTVPTVYPQIGVCNDWRQQEYSDTVLDVPCTTTCQSLGDITDKVQDDTVCVDLPGKDALQDDCSWYYGKHHIHCGKFDDSSSFISKNLCCACGGGSIVTTTTTTTTTTAGTIQISQFNTANCDSTRPKWKQALAALDTSKIILDDNASPLKPVSMRITMGVYKDYFKPAGSNTFEDMILSFNKHLWSPDGKQWKTPAYGDNGFQGGSYRWWPRDVGGVAGDDRYNLPIWGAGDHLTLNTNCGCGKVAVDGKDLCHHPFMVEFIMS